MRIGPDDAFWVVILGDVEKSLDAAGRSTQVPEDSWGYQKTSAKELHSGCREVEARPRRGTARLAEIRANGFFARNLLNDRPKTGNIIVEGRKASRASNSRPEARVAPSCEPPRVGAETQANARKHVRRLLPASTRRVGRTDRLSERRSDHG